MKFSFENIKELLAEETVSIITIIEGEKLCIGLKNKDNNGYSTKKILNSPIFTGSDCEVFIEGFGKEVALPLDRSSDYSFDYQGSRVTVCLPNVHVVIIIRKFDVEERTIDDLLELARESKFRENWDTLKKIIKTNEQPIQSLEITYGTSDKITKHTSVFHYRLEKETGVGAGGSEAYNRITLHHENPIDYDLFHNVLQREELARTANCDKKFIIPITKEQYDTELAC
jgi:hypothetical protein